MAFSNTIRPIQPYQNGSEGPVASLKSAFSNYNGAPLERIVHISGPNKNTTDQERPDIETITGGFIPISQIHNPFPDTGREYFLDSDLETIEEESSVLDSDLDIRSTPRNETPVTDAESPTEEKVNGYWSSRSISSLSDSQRDDFSSVTASTSSKIVYAKCLSPGAQEQQTTVMVNESGPSQSWKSRQDSMSDLSTSSVSELSKVALHQHQGIELTMSDMFQAVACGDLQTLRKFSSTEQSETVDERGNTLLHLAATSGQLSSIKFLLDGPLSDAISVPNDDLMTPSALAVTHGHLSCVQWMVENTVAKKELIVSSRQASFDGSSMRPPLAHVAARFNKHQVLDWLCEQMIKEGYSVDSADHHSNTATHEAAAHGHLKSLQVLVARGASVTVLNSHGDTPGQVADKRGQDLCVGYLVVVETCMSLAQQLIRVKLENENLIKDNGALKSQLQVMHHEKLAQAKELVDERINAALQSSSSTEDIEHQNEKQEMNRIKPEKTQQKQNFMVQKGKFDHPVAGKTAVPSANAPSHTRGEVEKTAVEPVKQDLQNGVEVSPPSTVELKGLNSSSSEQKANVQLVSKGRDETSPQIYKESKTTPKVNSLRKISPSVSNQQESFKGRAHQVDGQLPKAEPEKPRMDNSSAKAWEKMALDDLLRISRDSRYLPSPTISMCTEDSTMEPREAMRDQIAAASRWFLVQQSGGKAHLKDSKVSQRFRSPNHGTNTFTKHKKPPSGNKPHVMVGPIHHGVKPGPMPARIISTNNVTLSELPKQVKPDDQLRVNHSSAASTQEKDYRVNGHGFPVSAYRNNQIGSIASIRPTSARSSTSSTSTVRSNSKESPPSTPSSTTLSDRSVIENPKNDRENHSSKGPIPHTLKNRLIDQKRSPAPGSPASSVRSQVTNTDASFKNYKLDYPTEPKDVPHHTQAVVYTPNGMDTAQVTVPLPTRNNSFLRKVQPPSPTHIQTKGKSPIKTSPATTSTVASYPISPSKTVSPASNLAQPSGERKGNFSSYAYYLPRTIPKDNQRKDTTVTMNSQASPVSNPTKSPAKQPNSTHMSSNSPKTSGKKKVTKLFRF